MEQKKQKEERRMGLERLPSSLLIEEVLLKLEIETLCSVSCVNKAMSFSVSQALPLLSSINLSAFSPDAQILNSIVGGCRGLHSLTLNCLHLDNLSLGVILGTHLQELNLLSCSLLSYQVFTSIGEACPNLRVLVLELVDQCSTEAFKTNLDQMLNGCLCLESFSLKIRGRDVGANAFQSIDFFLPSALKSMKLQSVLEQDVIRLMDKIRVGADRNSVQTSHVSIPVSPLSSVFTLQRLSLVLDAISDELIMAISGNLPTLVELDLEDRPVKQPLPNHDLTNTGLQYLASFHHLMGLSLIRNRHNQQVSFKRVNDMGMFLLSEVCKGLESVRLCGFSKVSDAGYASILHSCLKLKKFEARNAFFLSDLAFLDVTDFQCSLVEVKLLSCRLITSETVKQLTRSRVLKVLDLCGCRSIADSCLGSISSLRSLSMLNLAGADITDYGLSVLAQGIPSITHLCLRHCERVTDEGISFLFHGGGTIRKTLSALDLGHMPRISAKAVFTIAMAGTEITELCLRHCSVTDVSLDCLAMRKTFRDECKLLRRLDLLNCTGLSVNSLRFLKRPSFPGLHWLGIGGTPLASKGYHTLSKIHSQRPWLTICLEGCEMGCYDGWQFHRAGYPQ
ncbi:hypothetical protein L3X38_030537 [Prunus dulcis]|uniref:F-box/LRR-repeat protein 15-like leucin rich repeat domain-containing protein n=1 Tax=Prunus dulcis TaxID=3755 RepID=A0AAD4VCM1_PRUDU|nr:hypothetical protein L3X38_030537 [Prunus dulcis]